MTRTVDKLRDKDQLVLTKVAEGNDDVQKITSETTLDNHQVRYAFEKLQELDLLTVSKPDRMIERLVDGQKRVFQHPSQAELTELGRQCLDQDCQADLDRFDDLSRQELVEKVHQLENRVEELDREFEIFRSQVLERLT